MEPPTFAVRLRQAIKDAGVDQKALAAHLGVTESQVSRYVSGKDRPKLEAVAKCAVFLDTTADFLCAVDAQRQTAPTPDLAWIIQTGGPLLWMGEPVTLPARRRVLATLRALLAPVDQLPQISEYAQDVNKAAPDGDANKVRNRVQVIADVPAKHPRGGRRGGAGRREPVGGSGA